MTYKTRVDPDNADWQRDLPISEMRIGDVAAAWSAYEVGLAMSTRLTALDPSNAQWRDDLQLVRQRLDDLGE